MEAIVNASRPVFPVTVVHSSENVGGLGRFLLMRRLDGIMGLPTITIDDDQVLFPDFVSVLLTCFAPRQAAGAWAWRFKPGGTYWDRERCPAGAEAHYLGTGGLILDPAVVFHDDFFEMLPERFRFVEDLWLSFYSGSVLGHKLIAAPDVAKCIRDGRDQSLSMRARKSEFLAWLRRERGWRV